MPTIKSHLPCLVLTLTLFGAHGIASAQDGRPQTQDPQTQQNAENTNGQSTDDGRNNRRPAADDKVTLAFDDVEITDTIAFIMETTGKVVIPVNPPTLKTKKITLVNDEPIDRQEALDRLFRAFRLNGVAIIEQPDAIIITLIDNSGEVPTEVIPSHVDIRNRRDKGTFITKIFKMKDADAEIIQEMIDEMKPGFASVVVDVNSNQLVVRADVDFCQQVQDIIDELDENYLKVESHTFRLKHADANEIATNIEELFSSDGTNNNTSRRSDPRNRGRQQQDPNASPGVQVELRWTVNALQNTVSIVGDPKVVTQIKDLVKNYWDLPRPEGSSKVYMLKYTDPVKMRDTIRTMLGQEGGTGGAGRNTRGVPGGGGAATDPSSTLGGIYQIEAIPDKNALVALSRTQAALDFLDDLILKLDQSTDIGLPMIIKLKHADAVEVTQELNILLSRDGANLTLQEPGSGLSGTAPSGEGDGATGGAGGTGGGGAAGTIQFPWQQGGNQNEEQSPVSSLIGKTRIVPIIRQNALAILAPVAMRDAVQRLVETLDQPGKQVLISAVICEVELTDDLRLGLRYGNSDSILGGALPDTRIGGTNVLDVTDEDILGSTFTTSVLTSGVSVNVALQALDQATDLRILQEPVLFTADNEEALFFDGQDVPIIDGSSTTPQGGSTQDFVREPVGVFLNIRPRITAQNDVDLDINLEVSSVVDSASEFTIVDRRQTTTKVIIKNGQTIAISGILRDEETRIERGIPLLSDIPLIGELFKSKEDTVRTTELIAFITPYVVENPEENYENFQTEYLDRLNTLSRPLKEQGDDEHQVGDRIRDRLDTGLSDDDS